MIKSLVEDSQMPENYMKKLEISSESIQIIINNTKRLYFCFCVVEKFGDDENVLLCAFSDESTFRKDGLVNSITFTTVTKILVF